MLSVFKAGNFAGVDEMERNPRLFDRVAPVGVADILLAVGYRAGGEGGDEAGSPPPLPPSSSSSVAGEESHRRRRGSGGSGLLPGVKRLVAFEGVRDNTIAAGAVGAWSEYCGDGESGGREEEASKPPPPSPPPLSSPSPSSASASTSTSSLSSPSRFELVQVDGDHYFVTTSMRKVTDVVSRVLLDAVEGNLLGEGHSWVASA